MLKKTERLNRSVFTEYFKKGKRNNGVYTTIITHPSGSLYGSVVVAKKVSKKAVVRNSIRRRLYGIIDNLKTQKKLTGVYIVIAKPEIIKLNKRQFNELLTEEIGRVVN